MKRPVKSKRIYDNCTMLSPDNEFMAHCSEKRMKWYLKRNLAEQVSETTFRLTFEPKGIGNADDVEYQLAERENKCVVCGITEKLTLHHIVPFCYRKHFPIEYKNRNSFDVVCMCHHCHDEYERVAQLEKKTLCERFSLQERTGENTEQRRAREMLSLLKTLQLYQDKIPEKRTIEIADKLTSYFNTKVDRGNLEFLIEQHSEYVKDITQAPDSVSNKVLEAFVVENSLFDFILYWREHFLKHAKPRHLNKLWIESYKTRDR